MVILNCFLKSRGDFKFKYDVTNTKWIDVDFINSSITMTFDRSQHVYILNVAKVEALNEFVSNNS